MTGSKPSSNCAGADHFISNDLSALNLEIKQKCTCIDDDFDVYQKHQQVT